MKKIGVLFVAAFVVVAAQAQTVVDTLTSGSLSAYTETIVLAQNGDPDFTFASSGSGLQVSRTYSGTGSGSAQQDLLLRNDYSLSVGNMLSVSISGLGTSAANSDFGIAIASQPNPVPTVWTSGTVSTRSNYLAMYVKPGSSQVGSIGFNGTTQLYSSGGVTPPAGSYSSITGLWIAETAPNVFSDGYTTSSGNVTLGSGLTFTGASIDNSIGFYADLRATETAPAIFSNLTISPIPEPSTLAMGGMGLASLLVILRRRK